MSDIPFLSAEDLEAIHSYPALITVLRNAFTNKKVAVPLRSHHHYGEGNTLLMMPSWQDGLDMGVKLVTVTPKNRLKKQPSIQGLMIYLDIITGLPLAIMDAATLTKKRTAAASALASSYLSQESSSSLLQIGTGALAPELIRAHCSVRPIREVYIWGRDPRKADELAGSMIINNVQINSVENLDEIAPYCDIISCATMAQEPILKRHHLRAGHHLDLVGSYKPDMREVDDEVIKESSVFVDTLDGATQESGDLLQPLKRGVIDLQDIKGELWELCTGQIQGRRSGAEITLFKSVGYALEDLVAARFYFENRHIG
ncbi:MAG: ornithine cyclodeaminase family protein [Lewinella sp.]|uniref:ornithine cyclodeaminase family protein n=1 Tax=Lewinella sp. TaxID=2004506 RepID=UPI003D6B2A4C